MWCCLLFYAFHGKEKRQKTAIFYNGIILQVNKAIKNMVKLSKNKVFCFLFFGIQ